VVLHARLVPLLLKLLFEPCWRLLCCLACGVLQMLHAVQHLTSLQVQNWLLQLQCLHWLLQLLQAWGSLPSLCGV
jgi:hypothetical protein